MDDEFLAGASTHVAPTKVVERLVNNECTLFDPATQFLDVQYPGPIIIGGATATKMWKDTGEAETIPVQLVRDVEDDKRADNKGRAAKAGPASATASASAIGIGAVGGESKSVLTRDAKEVK